MVSAVRTHPCRQHSYTKQRQVLAEEEEGAVITRPHFNFEGRNVVIVNCVVGFYFLFKNYQTDSESDFATVGDTVMMLFEMTLGEYKVSESVSIQTSVCVCVTL